MKKINKYFKDAYNNPSQYSITDHQSEPKNDKIKEIREQISKGVIQAHKDKANGTYKFI